jgi:thermostable 8-oxoguanine DNA glycosylase
MQTMYAVVEGAVRELDMPGADEFVLPGIPWGRFDELLTPAYWRGQSWQHQELGNYQNLRLGRSLAEEVTACLLGGFGMKAELGLAAFERLRTREMLNADVSSDEFETALAEPFVIADKMRRYRFPRQKAGYLAGSLAKLAEITEPQDDVEFRDLLADLPGIGPKTASWVVRNYRDSNRVAILDVHIIRAGEHIGLFPANSNPQRNYRGLESDFLEFSLAIAAPASMLDGLMWDYMRRLSFAILHPRSMQEPERQLSFPLQ